MILGLEKIKILKLNAICMLFLLMFLMQRINCRRLVKKVDAKSYI